MEDKAAKQSLSFGFSKEKKTKKLVKSAIHDEESQVPDDDVSHVTSFEKDRYLKKKKELPVIPLITTNRWKAPLKPEDLERDEKETTKEIKLVEGDNVESQAANEILREIAERDGEKLQDKNSTRSVPLLLANKVPDGFETDEKLNVEIRPESSVPADYDQMPMEHFGAAMLRGMGWNEGMGIGTSGRVAKPIEALIRPKAQGLGADRSLKKQQQNNGDSEEKKDAGLDFKIGAYCVINRGKHADNYGQVISINEENARATVTLTLSKEKIDISQFALTLVTKKDYEKNSKVLNKSKVDKYKEEEERKQNQKERHRDREKYREHKNGRDRDRERDKSRERERNSNRERGRDREQESHRHKDMKRDKYKEEYQEKHRENEKYRDSSKSKYSDNQKERYRENKGKESDNSSNRQHDRRDKYEKYKRHERGDENDVSRKKRKQEYSSSSESEEEVASQKQMWLRQHLRVRVIDEKYKKGKYFKTKVIIDDVIGPGVCTCRTEDGRVLENIKIHMLETVIPRTDPAYVMVVKGKEIGQLGEILNKDKAECRAMVQMLSDRDRVLQLSFDEICDYTGNIDEVFDY